mgnify:CR=1 FL=1
MSQDFLKDMLESHPEPSPELGMCLCGHEGIAGNAYCFICFSNLQQEMMTSGRVTQAATLSSCLSCHERPQEGAKLCAACTAWQALIPLQH